MSAARPSPLPAEPSSASKISPLQMLITIEGEALNAQDLLSLKHIAVNRSRSLIKSGHIIWVTRRGDEIKLGAISSQAVLDKTTPFAQWMTRQLARRARQGELDRQSQWHLNTAQDKDAFAYPFNHACYAPFAPDPLAGGLLFTRETAFTEQDVPLIKRLSQIFGIASRAMGRKKRARMGLKKRGLFVVSLAVLALLAMIPVPMTTLAPAEIVADTPYMITAPMDGVIKSIDVPPNTYVAKDTALVRLVDTAHHNDYILAGQEQSVADAKLRQASLTSFINDKAKGNIAIAHAEKALAAARQDYAKDQLSKTVLTAPREGLAIYTSPTEWAGRPVAIGETIIQIADPARILLRIDAPLTVGETLQNGARVKMFLDSDPLGPIEAEVIAASYYAQPAADGHMSYEAFASIETDAARELPRIGTRGVAKIYGRKAPLGFWILRRPLTIARQFLGL